MCCESTITLVYNISNILESTIRRCSGLDPRLETVKDDLNGELGVSPFLNIFI